MLEEEGRPVVLAKVFPLPAGFSYAARAYFATLRGGEPRAISERLQGRVKTADFFQCNRRCRADRALPQDPRPAALRGSRLCAADDPPGVRFQAGWRGWRSWRIFAPMSPDLAQPVPADNAEVKPALSPEPPAPEPPAPPAPRISALARAPVAPRRYGRRHPACPVRRLGILHLLHRLYRRCLCAVGSGCGGAGDHRPITAVHIVDNQPIKRGDRLVTIDPLPFQLDVNQRQAQIDESAALLKVAREELATAIAALDQATSSRTYAAEEQSRYADLARNSYAPRAELDKWNDELKRAQAGDHDCPDRGHQGADFHRRTACGARPRQGADGDGAMAAEQDGDRGADRRHGHQSHRARGRHRDAERPADRHRRCQSWRIIANYKQYYVRSFKIGDEAWVWLDSSPWQFHRARITGIARGFSRDLQAPMLLPYVAPTTDWIRLQRRIPVTVVLVDPPPGGVLYMGADARTVIFR